MICNASPLNSMRASESPAQCLSITLIKLCSFLAWLGSGGWGLGLFLLGAVLLFWALEVQN